MRRRLLAAAAALVLAVVGTAVLVAYANGADKRALEGQAPVPALIVTAPISAGTPASAIHDKVRNMLVPQNVAAPGRVGALSDLGDRVAAVDLKPGEQLLSSRFRSPDAQRAAGTVALPKGDQELSIQLDAQRAVGGRLASGDKVGVYVSYKLPDGTGLTHVVLHKVLVTQVQGAVAAASSGAKGSSQTAAAASTSLMITLGLTAKQAEPVVWGMEHGTVWLSLEPDDADTGGTTTISPGNVYTGSYR
jgi:pilus assembly protein CpaB